MMEKQGNKRRLITLLVFFLLGLFTWSVYAPYDYFTWFLEVLPILMVGPVLIWTYSKFQFSLTVYCLLALHAVILMIGAHYTYAQVPLFNGLKEHFGWQRNYYDRLGHFFQGFVPAFVIREILVKKSVVSSPKWLRFFVISICLAFSACFELFEWLVARITGSAADAFLATQGDSWDTQWDMAMALTGALTAQIFAAPMKEKITNYL